MTSLSNQNQNLNLKMEPQHLEPADQKNNLSLEPDRQRTSQVRPLEKSHPSKPQVYCMENPGPQTGQENQYSFEKEVEEQTREQYKSDRWHKERKYKLTSSRFGEICKRRKYDLKYCESLSTNQKDLSHIPAVKFGLNQEKVALEQFKQRMRFDVVKKARFFISKAYPHLGASPEGIVPASELNDEAPVEVKCSYANRFSGEPPNYLYKVASHFKLRRDHKYYYQIQGQLYCTGLEMCYLVVYTFPRLFIVRVYKDSNFCNHHMIPKLNEFYYQYFKPLIVDKHGLGVRLPILP